MNDDLAARRAAVLERVARKRRLALEQARQADEIDHTAAAILASRRAHPSNPTPYDQQQEEEQQSCRRSQPTSPYNQQEQQP